jgi:hypothetical protein
MARTALGVITEVDKNTKLKGKRWIVHVEDPNASGWIRDALILSAWDDLPDRSVLRPGKMFHFDFTTKVDEHGTAWNNLKRIRPYSNE